MIRIFRPIRTRWLCHCGLRRIKSFFGTSENAVKTQIWIAVSVYVLVAIIKKRLHLGTSLYTILQIMSVTIFEKMPLNQVLSEATKLWKRQNHLTS